MLSYCHDHSDLKSTVKSKEIMKVNPTGMAALCEKLLKSLCLRSRQGVAVSPAPFGFPKSQSEGCRQEVWHHQATRTWSNLQPSSTSWWKTFWRHSSLTCCRPLPEQVRWGGPGSLVGEEEASKEEAGSSAGFGGLVYLPCREQDTNNEKFTCSLKILRNVAELAVGLSINHQPQLSIRVHWCWFFRADTSKYKDIDNQYLGPILICCKFENCTVKNSQHHKHQQKSCFEWTDLLWLSACERCSWAFKSGKTNKNCNPSVLQAGVSDGQVERSLSGFHTCHHVNQKYDINHWKIWNFSPIIGRSLLSLERCFTVHTSDCHTAIGLGLPV